MLLDLLKTTFAKSTFSAPSLTLSPARSQLNFNGGVISDWGAAHTAVGSALGGLDWVGFSSASGNKFGDSLAALISNNTVPEGVLDDKILRWLTGYYALDQGSLPSIDFDRWVSNNESTSVALKLSQESITLLKNVRSTNETRGLPFNQPRDLLLVGSGARPAPYGYIANLNAVPFYAPSSNYEGWNSNGYGSGGSPQAYSIDPLMAFVERGSQDQVAVDYYGSECVHISLQPFSSCSSTDSAPRPPAAIRPRA